MYTKEKRDALEEYGKLYKGKNRIHPRDPCKTECLYAEFMELFGASESSQKNAHAFWEEAVEIINEVENPSLLAAKTKKNRSNGYEHARPANEQARDKILNNWMEG